MASNIPDTRPPSKGERLTVRFDEGELARVRQRSLAMGVATSAFARAVVLDAVGDGAVPRTIAAAIVDPEGAHADSPALRDLRVEVNRIGVNFNQLVRKVNAEGLAAVGGEESLRVLTLLADVLGRVESTLGGTRRAV